MCVSGWVYCSRSSERQVGGKRSGVQGEGGWVQGEKTVREEEAEEEKNLQ